MNVITTAVHGLHRGLIEAPNSPPPHVEVGRFRRSLERAGELGIALQAHRHCLGGTLLFSVRIPSEMAVKC